MTWVRVVPLAKERAGANFTPISESSWAQVSSSSSSLNFAVNMHFSFPLSVVRTLLCAFLEQNKRPALWLPFNFLTSYARLVTSFLLAVPYSTLVVWLLAACCENVGEMLGDSGAASSASERSSLPTRNQ